MIGDDDSVWPAATLGGGRCGGDGSREGRGGARGGHNGACRGGVAKGSLATFSPQRWRSRRNCLFLVLILQCELGSCEGSTPVKLLQSPTVWPGSSSFDEKLGARARSNGLIEAVHGFMNE